MTQKRIMILGGNYVQAEATRTAKSLGYYTISTDLYEDNPGHKIADEYCKVDIIDREAVLREAERLKIDGIIPFCSDVLAPIAAYVQEKMHLPGNPYSVIHTMTHKDLFRRFMHENGFLAPESVGVKSIDEAAAAIMEGGTYMMKPTDSAGSRGVFLVRNRADIEKSWAEVMEHSLSKTAIIEDYIESVGLQQDGDIFVIDGKIAFWGMGDQHKCENEPFVPGRHVYPSTQAPEIQMKARELVQKVVTKLGFRQGPCNLEYLVDAQERIWLLDIGPRNGGNLIPFMLKASTGVDLIELTVRQAVGEEITVPEPQSLGTYMTFVERENGKTVNLRLEKAE